MTAPLHIAGAEAQLPSQVFDTLLAGKLMLPIPSHILLCIQTVLSAYCCLVGSPPYFEIKVVFAAGTLTALQELADKLQAAVDETKSSAQGLSKAAVVPPQDEARIRRRKRYVHKTS